jgi:peptidoglycan/xylan/chitin deacetylase (PgdA/CDA1 family)
MALVAPSTCYSAAFEIPPKSIKATVPRLGIVVLQFDDGTIGHYTHAFRILEKYKIKGSFGVVTGVFGQPGKLTARQVVEMYRAGHEIHDHTLDHNAAFWGDPARQAQWQEHIRQSLGILKELGIETRGWNQPGGKGQNWTPALRETLTPHYDYVAGRVGLKPDEQCNMHWHLQDDPFCLGYGGVDGWSSRDSPEARRKAAQIKRQIADGLQQGLVTIVLFHVIRDQDGSAQGLEEICKFLRANALPVMRMGDAVKAVQTTRKKFFRDVEQIANPGFLWDLDGNGRPDGYIDCVYAPPKVKRPGPGRVAEFAPGTATWIYGPEVGKTQLKFWARSADGVEHQIKPVLRQAEIDRKYQYRWHEQRLQGNLAAGMDWKKMVFPVEIGENIDRLKIQFTISPPGKVYVAEVSWRVMP